MILLVTGWFDIYGEHGYPTGEKEFVVSHGVNLETGRNVVLPCDHPNRLGAVYDHDRCSWVIPDKKERELNERL
jgi:hypothetical protein